MWKLVLAVGLILVASGARAETLDVSPDVTVELGGATVHQQDVARDDLSGGAPGSIADLGTLPDGADVVGYYEANLAQQLFVLDISADLGGTYAAAGDVIAYDPGTGVYQIELDISAAGVPDGTRVDAFGLASNGDSILSFDVTVDLGGGLVASDEDLVTYSLGGGFAMLLDGSNVGVDQALDLDAASELNGNLLVSFDTDGSISFNDIDGANQSIDFSDEDVLSFDPVDSAWTQVYDGSAVHPGQWEGADLVAVPEPGAWSLMGAGMALLAGLVRRKRKLALLAALLLPASPGMASDGVLEVNQACAVNTGCFSGDAAGFPVEINGSVGRSYRLTSDLELPSASVSGIVITAPSVSIDLNGFEIVTTGCLGATANCTPVEGNGDGIAFSAPGDGDNRGISVKNGSITGMGDDGVKLGKQAEVVDLRVRWNGSYGISVQQGSRVTGNTAYQNGMDGIHALEGSTVSGNTAYLNGGDGIFSGNGANVFENVAYQNSGSGIKSRLGSTISKNTVYLNGNHGIEGYFSQTISGNTARSNTGRGIDTNEGSTVSGNTVISNGSDGIFALDGSAILENTVRENTGFGLNLACPVAYSGNTITNNTAGTASCGFPIVGNFCNPGSGINHIDCP